MTEPLALRAHYRARKAALLASLTESGRPAGGVRAVLEAVGVRDVLAKSMGSSNHAIVVKATLTALEQLRSREDRLADRGMTRLPAAAIHA